MKKKPFVFPETKKSHQQNEEQTKMKPLFLKQKVKKATAGQEKGGKGEDDHPAKPSR